MNDELIAAIEEVKDACDRLGVVLSSKSQPVNVIDPKLKLAVVPIKSALWSKINWGELVKAVSVLTAIWGFPIPEDVQGNAVLFLQSTVTVITVGGALYTFVVKTWFSGTVTPQSLPTRGE